MVFADLVPALTYGCTCGGGTKKSKKSHKSCKTKSRTRGSRKHGRRRGHCGC